MLSRKSLYDDDVLYWCNMKVKGKKRHPARANANKSPLSALCRNFKKSFVRKVIEYDEAAEDNDNSLECDFDGSVGLLGYLSWLRVQEFGWN